MKLVNRSKEREQAIIEKHTKEAEGEGLDAFRYQRTDSAGHERPDSGESLFSQEKGEHFAICIKRMLNLQNIGLSLLEGNLMKKEGEFMYYLVLRYGVGKNCSFPKGQWDIIYELFGGTYEFVHAFQNPNNSVTVNPSHRLRDTPAKTLLSFTNEGGKLAINGKQQSQATLS